MHLMVFIKELIFIWFAKQKQVESQNTHLTNVHNCNNNFT